MNAAEIYFRAVKKARKHHERMVKQFIRGEIEIASPCGLDREQAYIIEAFQRELDGHQ